MDISKYFTKTKKLFMRFWKSENNKVSLIRDVFVALMLVLIVLLALWTYTGQWFGAPMVAIESGSMQHLNEPFGRIGTIDAGDMVLLVKVNKKSDIETYAEKNPDNMQYGKTGDVVVYRPDGSSIGDQIIHRAMCWVEVEYTNGQKTYTIEGTNITNHNASEPIYAPELGIRTYNNKGKVVDWSHSGFITKGDNPITNPTSDQLGGITSEPVKLEWISGKARGEIPWIGTINLFFNDIVSGEESTVSNVPSDSLVCLVIFIGVLISIPVSLDIYGYIKSKKE
jgi:signal peptidase